MDAWGEEMIDKESGSLMRERLRHTHTHTQTPGRSEMKLYNRNESVTACTS